jgi:hypothetical protein
MLIGEAVEDGDWTRLLMLAAALGLGILLLLVVRKRL